MLLTFLKCMYGVHGCFHVCGTCVCQYARTCMWVSMCACAMDGCQVSFLVHSLLYWLRQSLSLKLKLGNLDVLLNQLDLEIPSVSQTLGLQVGCNTLAILTGVQNIQTLLPLFAQEVLYTPSHLLSSCSSLSSVQWAAHLPMYSPSSTTFHLWVRGNLGYH